MSPVAKYKPGQSVLVPESAVEEYRVQRALDEARFEFTRQMQNLEAEFAQRRDVLIKTHVSEVKEIVGEE